MYYPLIKKILFRLNPETAHYLSLKTLQFAHNVGLLKNIFSPLPHSPREVMGLSFPNPIGLAAGLDKNGDYIDALADLGFGFIEVGTVTPKPQFGNPQPRLFRLEKEEAIINRMGFNNKGVDHLIQQLSKTQFNGILGINIGKNHHTPLENAVDDYLYLFRRVEKYASYVAINISSPNTKKLRELQYGDFLRELLCTLKKEQTLQMDLQKKYIPLVVKIAPSSFA